MRDWNWNKIKLHISLVGILVYIAFMGWMSYQGYKNPNPRIIELMRTPVSYIDLFIGFMAGMGVCIFVFLLVLAWPIKRSSRVGNPPDGDGGERRRIHLLTFGKVVSIEDFKKMPPQGPIQRHNAA